ncbi:MAG TPA: hypothetical protein DDW30_02275 [Clostridiales bacterium]|nr:hypothetical protein [Clostridiales bacterium]
MKSNANSVTMKRILLLLLVFVFALVGCNLNGSGTSTETKPNGSKKTTEVPSNTETDTDTEPADDSADWLELARDGKALYAFVYQQTDLPDGVSSSDYAKIARTLAANWEEKSGVEFSVWSDRRIPDDIGGVIAVGNVAGYAGDVFHGLRYNDFRVTGDTGCITLAAYTYSALWIASEQMTDALALRGGSLCIKRSALKLSHDASYQIGALTVGGSPASDYLVDCTDTEKSLAASLIETVRSTSGEMLAWAKADSAEGNRIVIRKTDGLKGYKIARSGTEYRLEYGDGLSETLLRLYLENRFANVTGGGKLEMDGLVTVSERSDERIIITLNVLDVWQNNATPGARDDLVAAMLLSYLPDFVCLQEFDVSYRKAAGGLLDQTKDIYGEVTVEGVSQNNIWNPILYRKDRYAVVESGYLDLVTAAGAVESTTYPGAADHISSFRKLVWAVLRDRSDGSLYLVGNFHASVKSLDTHPAEATAISDTVQGVAARYEGCVTLLCGDYNSRRTEAGGVLEQLRAKGFADTYDTAKVRNDSGTWHELGKAPDGSYRTHAIDHILTLGGIDPQVYLVLTDESLLSASDHCPTVLAFTKS